MNAPVNLLGLDRRGLERLLTELGERPFRGRQVCKWIHRRGVTEFAAMTDLGLALRERLGRHTVIRPPVVRARQHSADGTRKWVLGLEGGGAVETVFIPDGQRGTLCVSSQVGCPLACSFCATGAQGFARNLAAEEIVGQLWLAARELDHHPHDHRVITNVVLMGMGEPLLNFDAVATALRVMVDDHAYGLARRRVTVSTAGLVPGIDRLYDACPVSLAVSLHAPVDALRDELVPLNRSHPLAELMAACRRFAERSGGDPITFEYVMLDGVNDSPQMARALVRLLSGVPAKVNLIPFNPYPGARYRRSPEPVIDAFRQVLIDHGLMTITRRTRGDDIAAACGQLVGQVSARAARHRRREEPATWSA